MVFLHSYSETNLNCEIALRRAGCSKWALRCWLRDDPRFAERFRAVRNFVFDEVEARLSHLASHAKTESDQIRAGGEVLRARTRDRMIELRLPIPPSDVEESTLADQVVFLQEQLRNVVPAGPTNGGAKPA